MDDTPFLRHEKALAAHCTRVLYFKNAGGLVSGFLVSAFFFSNRVEAQVKPVLNVEDGNPVVGSNPLEAG